MNDDYVNDLWDNSSVDEFTNHEVSLLFWVSKGRLHSMRKDGTGPEFIRRGNRIYYTRQAINEWANRKRADLGWSKYKRSSSEQDKEGKTQSVARSQDRNPQKDSTQS